MFINSRHSYGKLEHTVQDKLSNVRSGISQASTAKADILYKHGDVIRLGTSVTLTVLATPGHTDGCASYLLASTDGAGAPGAVFTGDALLIRGCGRTDFQGGSSEMLYESVHKQVCAAQLPCSYWSIRLRQDSICAKVLVGPIAEHVKLGTTS